MPVRYAPGLESPQPDEAETIAELIQALRRISETTFEDYGHAVRSVHAKSHGLLKGELRVLDHLPPTLAQGLFARPATYQAVLRFSTNPGDVLDDSVSTPRGLAVKVLEVEGARLPGSEAEASQDFVMANAPAFAAPDPKAFAKNLKILAATTDQPQGLKKVVSATLRGAEKVVETFGGESTLLKNLGGQPNTHILGETFWTQAPLRYGDYVAKLSVAPASPALTALTGTEISTSGHPDALREAVTAFFREQGGEWELRAQLLTNPETMPVEDSSVPWPEAESPYVAVARIIVPPQSGWDEERSREIDDGLSFSPWHGIEAHWPLGGIMRARKPTYEDSVRFRASHNGCPVHG
ncbi:catalase family protein [Roseomonas sp. E05]|uniref:catalase family protein n=1 Tax=Roseomonas sp. E05 TaxID=3046310 RepID=UPI0024BA8C9C|nr:catalase family protein [Roseomonas sp. E05]MDJ0391500.1 catalase family protein [Roseomonas sp. E05]